MNIKWIVAGLLLKNILNKCNKLNKYVDDFFIINSFILRIYFATFEFIQFEIEKW